MSQLLLFSPIDFINADASIDGFVSIDMLKLVCRECECETSEYYEDFHVRLCDDCYDKYPICDDCGSIHSENTSCLFVVDIINSGDHSYLRLTNDDIYKIDNDFCSDSNGVACEFMSYKGIGIKKYNEEADRDRSYSNQKIGENEGIAPQTGMAWNYKDAYYYSTEIIDTLADNDSSICNIYHILEKIRYHDEEEWKIITDYINMINKMREMGVSHHDMHLKNFGYHDGKMLCIDWGEEY